jgi:hypothetical protein
MRRRALLNAQLLPILHQAVLAPEAKIAVCQEFRASDERFLTEFDALAALVVGPSSELVAFAQRFGLQQESTGRSLARQLHSKLCRGLTPKYSGVNAYFHCFHLLRTAGLSFAR